MSTNLLKIYILSNVNHYSYKKLSSIEVDLSSLIVDCFESLLTISSFTLDLFNLFSVWIIGIAVLLLFLILIELFYFLIGIPMKNSLIYYTLLFEQSKYQLAINLKFIGSKLLIKRNSTSSIEVDLSSFIVD